ncbi:hypothetical protein F4824DRAFT_501340 [Ustulina deusta]|nr:hypothetical protein F4824DRAFT_501340 [Ustulina deusta]
MPSAQQHLPTETSKGTGTSASTFSINPLSEFVVRAAPWLTRLASVIQFGRTGDMTKPGNLGAPQPMNTLSNNSASSRTRFGIPSSSRSSRSTPASPPPAKRQKLDESNIAPGYSRATFTVVDVATSRKRSIGSESVADSQRSAAPNMSLSQPTVAEYRSAHKWNKLQRPRKNRGDHKLLAQEDIENLASRSIPPLMVDDDISEDDVDLINPSKELTGSHQLKRKQPEEHPISEFAPRFQGGGNPAHSNPSETFAKALDKVDRRMKSQQSGFDLDELAPSEEELAASRPTKRRKAFSPSLSKRGNILPTNFKGASTARTPPRLSTIMDTIVDQKSEATTIIGDGLRIVRGASGQCQYQTADEEDPDHCLLSIREIGHTLFPVDQDKNLLKPYRYLTLDIMKAKTILRCRDDDECCMVIISFDSLNLSNGAGPKLMIEFASVPEFSKFLQWVALYKGHNCPVTIQDCNRAKLEKDFDEIMRRAKSHRILSDLEIAASVASVADADDIRVIQHNRNNRSLRDHYVATESRSQPRLRDAMKSSPTSRSNGSGIASSQAWDDQLASVQQQTRTTRSSYAYIGLPESEPIPEGWTSLNAGWEKRWRNSLVYPNTGKNRATVDKDDIQRLDEGQFLNDNIIIFYLRFLQKNLEDENKDLAKRIYFQNTFFYDKLKPTKNGQGINYDSVKTWTSKVDLFSKDYIIVPINEYTHWYVAIICNAPKLVPSYNHEQDGDTKNEVIAIADGNGITQANSQAPSRNGVPNGDIDGQHVALPAQEEVVESLRRMSIDSSGHPSGVTKQKADNKSEEGVESVSLKCDHDVYEIKDSDRPETEVEHIATAANPQPRRKVGKKPGVGLRKCDPTQPRIITLDSLGATHSPTCSYLKQYLIAELRDKRGIEIASPGAMGTTAKDVPEQTNHCDCGLFLLGYIQEFLRGPDSFVKSLLQRDGGIHWDIDPSELRNNIRNLIFQLQTEQQNAEDVVQDRKRQAKKMSKKQTQAEGALSHTAAPATNLSDTPSKMELASQDCHDDEDKSKAPSALPHPQPFGSRTGSTGAGETMDRKHVADFEVGAKHAITNMQPSAPIAQNSSLRTTRHAEMGDGSNVEEMQARSKATPHVVASPREIQPTFDREIHQVPGTSPISPARTLAARWCSTSPGTEGSTNPQTNFLAPLAPETPSSKGSRGATPLDPVVVDDSDNNRREKAWQSPQRHRGGQAGRVLVVEIPSSNIHSRSPGQDDKTDGQKQVGQQSPYFLNRRDGERVVAAKIREKPPNDVIDLSGD